MMFRVEISDSTLQSEEVGEQVVMVEKSHSQSTVEQSSRQETIQAVLRPNRLEEEVVAQRIL